MKVSKALRKQIILEILALVFLIAVIVYSIFAITKGGNDKISSVDNMVMVLDDSNFKGIKPYSDGEGLDTDGISYTVTNNNDYDVVYEVVLIPNIHDDEVLNQIKISVDDLYVEDLTSLERSNGGYLVTSNTLKPGYTKIHLIKYWYKLDTDVNVTEKDLNFEYRLFKKEK